MFIDVLVHGVVVSVCTSLYNITFPPTKQETVKLTSLLSVISEKDPEAVEVIQVLLTTVGRIGVTGLVLSITKFLFPERLFESVGSTRDALLSLLSRILAPVGRLMALSVVLSVI